VSQPLSAQRFFIVGGAGFIGSHFCDQLLGPAGAAGVTLYDNYSSGRPWHHAQHDADPRFRVVRGEVEDARALATAMDGHDVVILLASNPDIARAAREPTIDFTQGTALTSAVVEAMRTTSAKRILYASGSGVYGELGTREGTEDMGPLIPVSTYGASKLAGEALIASYAYMFGLSGCGFRFGNVVGPRQTHGVGFDFARRLLAAEAAGDNPITLRILGDGTQSKSYVLVTDIVRAVLTAHDKTTAPFAAHNVATGGLHHGRRDRRAGGGVRRFAGSARRLRLQRRRPRLEGGRPHRPPRHGADPRARLALRALHARGAPPIDAGDDPRHESGEDVSAVSLAPPTNVDPEIEVLVPAQDVAEPELSIVIPALNEQLTIADFVAWCHEGMKKAGVVGEILIIDSGGDRTTELALAGGARVLRTPKRGLGRAYIDALPFIRGRYIVMGDADCTYDFRELGAFVEKFRGGAEFIMGSRFRGFIEPGSMPPLHRYLGTPVTTAILNVIFGSRFSDIHCGMRGITKAALGRMDLRSQSWEYASEKVLKSVHMNLRTEEVPIRFLKDRDGRLSHHKRSGWFSPWAAAWINLRAMFVYGADFFLYKPGLILLAAGLLLTLPLSFGTLTFGPVTFDLHGMLLGLSLSILGLQCVYMGILSQIFFDWDGDVTAKWFRRFPYNRSVAIAAALFGAGLVCGGLQTRNYLRNGFQLLVGSPINNLAATGLLLSILGFMTFTFTLILHSTAVAVRRKP